MTYIKRTILWGCSDKRESLYKSMIVLLGIYPKTQSSNLKTYNIYMVYMHEYIHALAK